MIEVNKTYCIDNLELLKQIDDESIDLVYIDPPFSTGKVFKTKNGELAYKDKFTLDELLNMLEPRLAEIYRILKPTGSFYIHGDCRFIPYVRIICDKIFGINNFRNEIIWCYHGASNDTNNFLKKHDNILKYSKSDNYIFNPDNIRVPYNKETIARYKRGKPGRGNKTELNFLGKIPEDWWEFSIIKNQPEKTGYPTQKPKELLERILKASLPYNQETNTYCGIVLDCFAGSGTTLEVAQQLGVYYIGCDNSEIAIKYINNRLGLGA